MRQLFRRIFLFALIFFSALSSAHDKANDSVKYTTESIRILGDVDNKLVLSVEDWKKWLCRDKKLKVS